MRLVPWLAALVVAVFHAGILIRAAASAADGAVLTGLTHIDIPVYYACARQPFDHPGIVYANP
jgi:hypothetical protein